MVFIELLWSVHNKLKDYNVEIGGGDFDRTAFEKQQLSAYPQDVKQYLERFKSVTNCYRTIQKFLIDSEESCTQMDVPLLYLSSFCEGIRQVLDEYEYLLCDIEKMVIEDEHISIVTIIAMILPVSSGLESVVDCVNFIQKRHITGCDILNVCMNYYRIGTGKNREVFKTITKYCLEPFFMQTKTWILKAELYDPHLEYFIKKSQIFEESKLNSGTNITFTRGSDGTLSSKYYISPEKLPTFLPYSLATKILFIGNSLRLCGKDLENTHSKEREEILKEFGLDERSLVSKLEQTEFCLNKFDCLITDIWINVDRYIRRLSDVVGDLKNQLILMRDIYLLGRGELFQEFLIRAKSLLTSETNITSLMNIEVAFKNSVYSVYLTDSSELLDSVSFKIPPQFVGKKVKPLDYIELEMTIRWPLQSLFSKRAMKNYNKMFKFLLRLKRAQMDITEVWLDTYVVKHSELHCKTMVLRNDLITLISNLQNYYFINVIAKETDDFMDKVNSTNTFTEMQSAHVIFQENILQLMFINEADNFLGETCVSNEMSLVSDKADQITSLCDFNKKVRACFKIIFAICQNFSLLVKQGKIDRLDIISYFTEKLNSTIKTLIKLTNTIDKNNSNQYLITILDFNGYFRQKVSETT